VFTIRFGKIYSNNPVAGSSIVMAKAGIDLKKKERFNEQL
jgi:hypothetical protein